MPIGEDSPALFKFQKAVSGIEIANVRGRVIVRIQNAD
jgi:hypothetical protein